MYSLHSTATTSRPENATSAGSLLASIRADPSAPIIVGITGIGGVGKRSLLDDIERLYRAAGMNVQRGAESLRPSSGRPGAVLIDDAHQLPDDQVRRLQELVTAGESTLIASYRMWPRSAAFARLVRTLERERPAVFLGPLTPPEVAERLRTATGMAVSPTFANAVTEYTGGMPWLVHHIVEGSRHDSRSVFEKSLVPDAVLDRIAIELANLDPGLHDVLLALAVGFEPTDQLSAFAHQDDSGVQRTIADATSEGLLLSNGSPIPLVKQALLRRASSHQVHRLQLELIDSLVASGRSLDRVAHVLVKDGLQDPRLVEALETAADHALVHDPSMAARLYAEAAQDGDGPHSTSARRAQAAWALGDLDEAGRILDDLLGVDDPPDAVRAVQVAAAVWAERGMMERSAEVFRWLGPSRAGIHAPLGAIAMIATGDAAGAAAMVAGTTPASPTTLGVAIRLMGEGIRGSIEAEPDGALSSLVRASDMMTAAQRSAPFPDSPAALASIAALHLGDPGVAVTVLDETLAAADASSSPSVDRLRLMRAWTAMQADRLDEARAFHAVVRVSRLNPRDEFLLRALEIGIARRSDDHFELSLAWQRARAIVLHVPVDLFTLLPLGEMMIAGARLADSHRLDEHVAEAWSLLGRLGDPPLWSICLHWSSIQAGILAERPSEVAAHTAALVRFAPRSRLAAVLASAAKAWVQVLAGTVDATSIEHNARSLAAAGFPWDGSRLAGHAAVRVGERKDMARLLACARALRAAPSSPVQTASEKGAQLGRPQAVPRSRAESARDDSGLSAREREVARLVLAGKTYREIGETIFISARTAEHHIARIRRQLGATNRSDLLAQLRIALGTDNPDEIPE